MIDDDETLTADSQDPAPLTFARRERGQGRRQRGLRGWARRRRNRPPRPRVRKLRLFLVTSTFLGLAAISTVFGMLTALASDLPQLENSVEFKSAVDSYLYDRSGQPIGVLAPPQKQVFVGWSDLNANRNMVNAIVAVEDKRFWSSSGIDIRSLARAFEADVTGGATQGASTIPEEFVKNVLNSEHHRTLHRTVFEKLVEAGLAFQLVHKWSKEKIITEYLNAIYFGNGATGVEAAARTYFGEQYGYNAVDPTADKRSACGDRVRGDLTRKFCVEMLDPAQAALLAGMVANPSAFNPLTHPQAALGRRNLVLQNMYQQGYIDESQYQSAKAESLPASVQQPQEPSAAPYFTAWVRPQVIRALRHEGLSASAARQEAYYGGLKIHLTLDLQMQHAAQQAVDAEFAPGSNGPTASLVAIDNRTGEVRAMVSGDGNYQQMPFNLATLGYRQPGSAFKMFTLASALSRGVVTPDSVFDSKPLSIPFHPAHSAKGFIAHFRVRNFANEYNGPETLTTATEISDNSVFAQVGMKVGTKHIKHYAQLMGIRSPISTTPAMILGGLKTGVSALDMAHAYETVATGGDKIYNPILGDVDEGPVGIHEINDCTPCRQHRITNYGNTKRVLSPTVAAEITSLLHGPVSRYGTAPLAAIPGVAVAGKTGTTSNFVDAWFVGWTPELTVAVWVGYPSSGKPMLTNYNGQPVEGGTFPAIIWHNFMVNALQILANEAAHKTTTLSTPLNTILPSSTTTTPATGTTPTTPTSTQPSGNSQTTSTPAAGGQTTTPGNQGGNQGGGGTSTTTPPATGGGGTGTSGGSGLP